MMMQRASTGAERYSLERIQEAEEGGRIDNLEGRRLGRGKVKTLNSVG